MTFKALISLMISSSFPVICQLIFNEIKDRLKMEADHSKGILNNIILSLLKIRGETKHKNQQQQNHLTVERISLNPVYV